MTAPAADKPRIFFDPTAGGGMWMVERVGRPPLAAFTWDGACEQLRASLEQDAYWRRQDPTSEEPRRRWRWLQW